MNFNSLDFLIFLVLTLLLYWVIPGRFRWLLLLVASYYFYMSWNIKLVVLILATTFTSYFAGILLEKTQDKKMRTFLLVATLTVCLGILIFFKYFDFLAGSVIDLMNLFGMKLDPFALNLLLPVGISFYTFQTLSYVIDVYRGTFPAEKHLGYYALFVCYFPQLVAGPIERPGDLIPQLKATHKFNMDDFLAGLRILLCGFFLKCASADVVGVYVNNVFNNVESSNALSVMIAGLLFDVQMFGDFGGYSLIAMGCARMMGVRLTRNFDRPYLAKNYSDFFRRWHITLTRWFTDYVYIPLGGNRQGTARRLLNTLIVFGLCGLWHGANWTYVVWGLYAAFLISFEVMTKKPVRKLLQKLKIDPDAGWLRMLHWLLILMLFMIASLIFRADSLEHFWALFTRLFTEVGFGQGYFDAAMASLGMTAEGIFTVVLINYCIVSLHHFEYYEEKHELTEGKLLSRSNYALRSTVYLYTILAIAIYWFILIASEDASAFLYFQF